MKKFKEFLQRLFYKLGYELQNLKEVKEESQIFNRWKLLQKYNINVVFDIGANGGQFGLKLRDSGYTKKIISFEPLSLAYDKLQNQSENDDLWFVENFGFGNKKCELLINIAKNSYSSSILEMLPQHITSAPHAINVSTEKIALNTLDSIFTNYVEKKDNVMLKIDTQGYEKFVLDGGLKSLKNVSLIELEMSLIPLYKDETLLPEMLRFMKNLGYILYYLENEFVDPITGQLLQVNGIFINRNYGFEGKIYTVDNA